MSGISSTGGNQPNSSLPSVHSIRLPRSPGLRGPQQAIDGSDSARKTFDTAQLRPGLAASAGGISAIERSVHGAQVRVDDLDRVGALLDDLRALVGAAQRGSDSAGLADIQSRIDSIVRTISDASAQAVSGRQPTYEAPPQAYSLFRNESITTNASGYAKFAPGQEAFSLDVVVTTSAQQAGFLLSFGGTNLNLGGAGAADGENSRFTLQLKTHRSAPGAPPLELSFVSGSTIQDVAWAINSFSDATDVTASIGANGTSLLLRTRDYGADAFTSVRIFDDGQINSASAWAGFYQLKSDNTNALAPNNAGRVLFSAASNDVVDHGQDVQATIGGVQATGKGLNIRATTDTWRLNIDLSATFAAGLRQSTPVAWFFPNPSPDASTASAPEAPFGADPALRPAHEFIPGFTNLASELRAAANDRLTELKDQLRAALGSPQKPDEKQTHLETLAALRRSLLGQ